MRELGSWYQKLVNFIFPKLCIGCGYPGSYICARCIRTKLAVYPYQACHVCRQPIASGFVHRDCKQYSHLDGVFVCMAYTDLIKTLIVNVKYNYYSEYLHAVVELMAKLTRSLTFTQTAAFTSVPLSHFKLWKRGFNQAEILGRGLAKAHGSEYVELLKRTHNTQTQVGKDKMSRQDNLQNAFAVRQNHPQFRRVVLVDDVMTTGTTLERCAKCLKQGGVQEVYAIVLARGS